MSVPSAASVSRFLGSRGFATNQRYNRRSVWVNDHIDTATGERLGVMVAPGDPVLREVAVALSNGGYAYTAAKEQGGGILITVTGRKKS